MLVGRKRWCIFRPELSRKEVFGNGRKSMPKEEEAIHWFSDIFPTLKVGCLALAAAVTLE